MAIGKRSVAKKILKQRDLLTPEEFVSQTRSLTDDPRLVSKTVPLGEQLTIASNLLIQILQSSVDKPIPKQPQSESKNIAIKITPSEEQKISLKSKDTEFVSDINGAGIIGLSNAEMAEVREYLPEGFSSEQLTTAFHLYSQGVTSKQLEESLDQSPIIETLTEKQAQSLYGTAYLVAVFEDYDPQRSIALSSQSPSISIEEVSLDTESSPLQIVFEIKENFVRPVIEKVVGKGMAPAKKKIKGFALKALKKSGNKLAKEVFKKGASALAAKAGTAAAAEALGAAIGVPFGGPIGAAVGAALAWVGSKVLGGIKKALSKISEALFGKRDRGKTIATIGGVILLGGIVLASAPLVLLGGLLGLGGLISLTGGIALGTGIAAYATAIILAITTPARTFIVWLVVAIVVVPLLVAFFLFIINSGAYLVPPGPPSVSALVENPYIGLEKLARRPDDPDKCTETKAGPGEQDSLIDCENADLSLTIEYTITVTAKRGTLTNITFKHKCTVIRDGSKPSCPSPLPSETPSLISSAEDFIFTYTASYGSSFTDSLVINTFTVTADVESEGVTQTEAISTASIRIGDPPDQCPQNWPVSGSYNRGPYASGTTHTAAEAVDIGANTGTPVSARHSGVARVFTIATGGLFGNSVEIVSVCPSEQFFSRYSHLSSLLVNSGDFVSLGQIVGEVGSTGNSTGPHLHYEFRGPSGPKSLGNPPNMLPPYVDQVIDSSGNPVDPPRGCPNESACGNMTVP